MKWPRNSTAVPITQNGLSRKVPRSSTLYGPLSKRRICGNSRPSAANNQLTRESPFGERLKSYHIAVIAGDGIGREVMPEGLRVLETAGRMFDFTCTWEHFDWSCE